MLTMLAILTIRVLTKSAAARRGGMLGLFAAAVIAASASTTAAGDEGAQVRLVGATNEIAPAANVAFLRPFDGTPTPVLPPVEAKVGADPRAAVDPARMANAHAEGAPTMIDAALEFAFAEQSPSTTLTPSTSDAQVTPPVAPVAQIRVTGVASYFTPLPDALSQILPTAAAEPIAGEPVTDRRIYRPVTQLTVDAALPPGPLPETAEPIAADSPARLPEFGDGRTAGAWGDVGLEWAASGMWHRPLYFEEVNLERYGYGCRPILQPAVSSAHFFLTAPALPYLMTAHCPHECVYTLGNYRPGSCVPWQRNWPPCSIRGGLVEAGTVVGLVFLIP